MGTRKKYITIGVAAAAAIATIAILASYTLEVRTEININAPSERVWSVLTDFNSFPT